jgi:hypothetical protein
VGNVRLALDAPVPSAPRPTAEEFSAGFVGALRDVGVL